MAIRHRHRFLALLLAGLLLACSGRPPVSESQLVGSWRVVALVNGAVADMVYVFRPDHSFKATLSRATNGKAEMEGASDGKWTLQGRSLRLVFDGRPDGDPHRMAVIEIDRMSDAEWTLVEDGQTFVMRRTSEAAVAASEAAQAPPPARQEPEIVTLKTLSSQFIADNKTYSVYYRLPTAMYVKIVAAVGGGPVTLIARKGHFSENAYMTILGDLAPYMVMAAVGGEDGNPAKKHFYETLNELTSSPLSKIDAYGRYESEWVELPAGEHTVMIDNSGELGERRGDVVVDLTVFGSK